VRLVHRHFILDFIEFFQSLRTVPRDATALLSISTRSLSRLIAARKIAARKDGSRTLVDVASVKAYLRVVAAENRSCAFRWARPLNRSGPALSPGLAPLFRVSRRMLQYLGSDPTLTDMCRIIPRKAALACGPCSKCYQQCPQFLR
jgi:hypothetical protein